MRGLSAALKEQIAASEAEAEQQHGAMMLLQHQLNDCREELASHANTAAKLQQVLEENREVGEAVARAQRRAEECEAAGEAAAKTIEDLRRENAKALAQVHALSCAAENRDTEMVRRKQVYAAEHAELAMAKGALVTKVAALESLLADRDMALAEATRALEARERDLADRRGRDEGGREGEAASAAGKESLAGASGGLDARDKRVEGRAVDVETEAGALRAERQGVSSDGAGKSMTGKTVARCSAAEEWLAVLEDKEAEIEALHSSLAESHEAMTRMEAEVAERDRHLAALKREREGERERERAREREGESAATALKSETSTTETHLRSALLKIGSQHASLPEKQTAGGKRNSGGGGGDDLDSTCNSQLVDSACNSSAEAAAPIAPSPLREPWLLQGDAALVKGSDAGAHEAEPGRGKDSGALDAALYDSHDLNDVKSLKDLNSRAEMGMCAVGAPADAAHTVGLAPPVSPCGALAMEVGGLKQVERSGRAASALKARSWTDEATAISIASVVVAVAAVNVAMGAMRR